MQVAASEVLEDRPTERTGMNRWDKVEYIPHEYRMKDPRTDYKNMIQRMQRTLFVFNENKESFEEDTLTPGGGNAIVRPYKKGYRGNYSAPFVTGSLISETLDPYFYEASMDAIIAKMREHGFQKVIVPVDKNNKVRGSIFANKASFKSDT